MEIRAVGAHNRTTVCNFEESDGIGRSLTYMMSDSIGWIAYAYLFLSLHEMHYGINITKSYVIGRPVGTKNWMESEHTRIASDYVRQLQYHETV